MIYWKCDKWHGFITDKFYKYNIVHFIILLHGYHLNYLIDFLLPYSIFLQISFYECSFSNIILIILLLILYFYCILAFFLFCFAFLNYILSFIFLLHDFTT